MKYLILASMLSLYCSSSFALGQTASRDCCPLGNNCGGKINCPGTGVNRDAQRRDVSSAKKKKNVPSAAKKVNIQ